MSEAKMLDGKVCVVTGGGGAIGGEIAKLMAAHGARVVVNDLGGSVSGDGGDEKPARDIVAAIEDAGGKAIPHFGSVAERRDTEDMIKTAVDAFGQVDCIVNNAGILRDVIFHKMNEPDWDMVIQVHLKGSFNVARSVAPYFREQGSGSMIHFTSTSGLIGNFGQANYAAAKLGIVGLSKSIALDMQRFGVRSNCISPFAWSRMIGTIPSDTPEQQARLEKIKRMTPAQQAPLAVYLASDAAAHVTGQIFGVRANEIFLFSQPRPIRSAHRSEGWTPETIAEHGMPALEKSFFELERSADVFSWDPV
ncbi:3-hydroxyacyl-CoA dehydrogenase [Minwuia thermotolerans]|uniref:3-hydroxyacyl-CoA dehydrogenase n=2 Tax=Minwuia thermotolerans TaxID=2056226 RepID=A0A2M9G0M2_9PROT|nr:SDR family NAD(P)-dependent oxidoreductase [Minwuia thermotolerans]PJK29255.1 3-hydroxyacyl-CoA dehydrogenase [Minwuia thermotolerans]